jgi:putative ABC transport system permease protein
MIPLAHVVHELLAERTRLLLTVLAIAWGTASVTTMLALGEGLRLTFARSDRGMGEGIVVVWPGQTSKAYGGLPEGHPVRLVPDDIDLLRRAIPEMASVSGEGNAYPQLRHGERFRTSRVMGVHPEYGDMRHILPVAGGRFIDPIDLAQRRRVAVIGPQVAKELYGDGVDPVGQTLEIAGREFTVVGVMQRKFQTSTYGGPDRDGTWIPITTFQLLFDRRDYANLVAKPRRPEDMQAMQQQLREVIARRRGLNPEDKELLNIWDTQEQQRITGLVFGGLQIVLGVVGGLTLVVAGVGIANVMYVSVSGATRDIGIRVAVGARSWQVLGQYVLEGLLATAVGGAVGLAATHGLVKLVDQIPMEGEFFSFVGRPVPVLSSQVALIVVGLLGLIGLLAGFFPARRAAQVDPAEALRHD